MAHKTGAGSTKNSRDSHSKRLGIKCIHLQKVKKGEIIVRQRGLTYKNGDNVGCGKDYTLYALENGIVEYTSSKKINIIKNV